MSIIDVNAEFELIGKEKFPDSVEYFFTAIPENGFSGILALRRLAEELGLEQVGYANSDLTNTIFRFEDGEPLPMIPIYANDTIFTLLIEFPVSSSMTLPIGRLIHKISKQIDIEHLVMLSSAPSSSRREKSFKDLRVFGAFVNNSSSELIEKLHLEKLENGTISGPFAWVLNHRFVEQKRAYVLLAETYPNLMADPASAAKLLDIVGKLINEREKLNVQQLIEESHQIKAELKKLQQAAEKAQRGQTPQLSDFYT